ncbi:MAG: hypothetical protein FWG33_01725 [Oscillospiraceae bacterium]|nr:hypothetical protein [Oscillospiraceae bacterium]
MMCSINESNTQKEKKSKMITVICVVLAVLFGILSCLIAVNAFWGNPISKMIAEKQIRRYLDEVYSSDCEMISTGYNFYSGVYVSEVRFNNPDWQLDSPIGEIIDPEKLEYIESIDKSVRGLSYSNGVIVDGKVSEHYQNLFDAEYETIKKELSEDTLLQFPPGMHIYTGIIADEHYSSDFEQLKVWSMLYFMGVKNFDKTITEPQSKDMTANLILQFINRLENHYHFKSTQAIYVDKNGCYETIVNNKAFSFEILSKNTRKFGVDEMGEEEIAFIQSLN